MGVAVIVMGRSGTGKSTSMRTFAPGELGLVNVLGKPLPFRSKIPQLVTTDYERVKGALAASKARSVAVDDAGYLITDMFMMRHSSAGIGNGVYQLYNDIGDSFYTLLRFIASDLPADKIVYVVMHEDSDDFGRSRIKTIGKLLDEKVTVEGMVSIVLRSTIRDGEYLFQTNGEGICKSPEGMFAEEYVPNDLRAVDAAIREYWGLAPLADERNGETK